MSKPARIEKPVAEMSEDEFTEWLCALPPPEMADDDFASSIARARGDVAAGRTYPHGVVVEWSKTWGKPDRKSLAEWLADRHD